MRVTDPERRNRLEGQRAHGSRGRGDTRLAIVPTRQACDEIAERGISLKELGLNPVAWNLKALRDVVRLVAKRRDQILSRYSQRFDGVEKKRDSSSSGGELGGRRRLVVDVIGAGPWPASVAR